MNELSYIGLRPLQPTLIEIFNEDPTTQYFNYPLGTIGIVRYTESIWCLTNKENGIATWQQLSGSGGSGTTTYNAEVGSANEVGQTIIFSGGNNTNTEGSGSTITINTDLNPIFDSITLPSLSEGVVVTNASGELSTLSGTDGQLILGGTAPMFASLTSSDGSVTFSVGPNFLQISAGGSGAVSFQADTGIAIPSSGLINMLGQTPIVNTNTLGDGMSDLTVNLSDDLTVDTITLSGDLTTTSGGVRAETYEFPGLSEGVLEVNTSSEIITQPTNDGELAIGPTTAGVMWNTITDTATVTATNGPNSITLNAAGSGDSYGFLGVSTATPSLVDGTIYTMGSNFAFNVIESAGGAFTGGNGAGVPAQFVAPETALYQIGFSFIFSRSLEGFNAYNSFFYIVTSNRTYTANDRGYSINYSGVYVRPHGPGFQFETMCDLDAGDTVRWQFRSQTTSGTYPNYTLTHLSTDLTGPSPTSTIIWGMLVA